MGKKKSVVLLILISIVTAVLCVICAFPSIHVTKTKIWKPATTQYDLDYDLGGGYYTTYYPKGVVSAMEYQAKVAEYEGDTAKLDEYKESYKKLEGTNLYFSTDVDDKVVAYNSTTDVLTEENLSEDFVQAFENAKDVITARYEKMGYSSFKVATADKYSLKIVLPASEANVNYVMTEYAYVGQFDITDGTDSLFTDEDGQRASDAFVKFTAKERNGAPYIEIKVTGAGKSKISSWTSDSKTLTFMVGDNTVLSGVSASYISDLGSGTYALGMQESSYAKIVCNVLSSALETNETGIAFENVEIASFDVQGSEEALNLLNKALNKALNLLYIAVGIVVLLALVLPIVLYKGYGVAMMFSTLLYFDITTFCFAFVSKGVFEVSTGTVFAFLVGLVVILVLGAKVQKTIKNEVSLGKTVFSAIKAGFNKNLMFSVDVVATLFIVALACLIGAGPMYMFSLQAMICIACSAFCVLLWTRIVNFLFVSASKDAYKYFHFVREDDDDE